MKKRGRPTQKQEEKLLAWVNRQRAVTGRRPITELPLGEPDNPDGCPIALALSGRVRGSSYDLFPGDYPHPRPLPGYVQTFVERFDAGAYPELEKYHD